MIQVRLWYSIHQWLFPFNSTLRDNFIEKPFFFCSMSFLENKIARLNHVIKVSVFKSFKQFLKSPVWYIYKRVNGLLSKWFIYFFFFFWIKRVLCSLEVIVIQMLYNYIRTSCMNDYWFLFSIIQWHFNEFSHLYRKYLQSLFFNGKVIKFA